MRSLRKTNLIDKSEIPVDSEIRTEEEAEMARLFFNAKDLESLNDERVILRQSLNVDTVISTVSSFAKHFQYASSRPHLQSFAQIGEGLQGAIFEQLGKPLVIKKEHPEAARLPSNLMREYSTHEAVIAAFDRYEPFIASGIHVPRLNRILDESDKTNLDFVSKLPEKYRSASSMVEMERILPLPKVVRMALISTFHPRDDDGGSQLDEILVNQLLDLQPNKHCLIRTYLGQHTAQYKPGALFSLRNFHLPMSSMIELELNVQGLAEAMGKAFAMMHWGAGVDGDDVEFVLGTKTLSVEENADDFQQYRAVSFFLLDFGQCESVDLLNDSVATVYQKLKGAMVTGDNQLFIPHYKRHVKVFGGFKSAYMGCADFIISDKKLENKFSSAQFFAEYEEYCEDFL